MIHRQRRGRAPKVAVEYPINFSSVRDFPYRVDLLQQHFGNRVIEELKIVRDTPANRGIEDNSMRWVFANFFRRNRS